jgi:hypothetical protein
MLGKSRHFELVLTVGLLCVPRGWGQDNRSNTDFSLLLKDGVRRANISRAGLAPVDWPLDGSGPQFLPIQGLDNKDAVPFLPGVLRGESNESADGARNGRGTYFYNARCYAALCLGVLGDERAFQPLVEVINKSVVSEGVPENQPGSRR